MPSACSCCVSLLLILNLSGCESDTVEASREEAELNTLEAALGRLSLTEETRWLDALEQVKKLKPTSRSVLDVQRDCVAAYEKYGDALVQLTRTRRLVRDIESAAAEGRPMPDLALRKDEAARAISETNRFLDDAEALVNACTLKKQQLRSRIAASD